MVTQNFMDLNEYLVKYRINHEEFAKKLGMTRKTLYFLTIGKTDPRLSVVRKIEKATNGQVTAADFPIKEELES